MAKLFHLLCGSCLPDPTSFQETLDSVPVPDNLCTGYERPDISTVIENLPSRYKAKAKTDAPGRALEMHIETSCEQSTNDFLKMFSTHMGASEPLNGSKDISGQLDDSNDNRDSYNCVEIEDFCALLRCLMGSLPMYMSNMVLVKMGISRYYHWIGIL